VARAIGLVSGGLDSVLAARLLTEQGIDVLCVCFISAFFGAQKAEVAAKRLNLPLLKIDFTKVHMDMVKAPPSGYGKNMNPCIDCHAMMLNFAGKLMEKDGWDFLFTGEVLGQRPMSQNYGSLNRVAKLSGYKDKILRPLSAKVLDITEMEESGLVDRNRLEGFNGRSRKPQFALAEKLGIMDYEAPGGGCLLTDPGYSDKLRDLFKVMPCATDYETGLLRKGRIFWLKDGVLAIGGRDQNSNMNINRAARESDYLLSIAPPYGGATIMLTGKVDDEVLNVAARLAVRYSKAPADGLSEVIVTDGNGKKLRTVKSSAASDTDLEKWRRPC
jgi:hypothetical protein